MALTGPDVSHWQGAINWPAVAGAGHSFAWCKATEGTSFRDGQFSRNWAGIRAAGMVRGAYHFLRSDRDPRAQARHFLNVVGDLSGSMAALDVESTGPSYPRIEHVVPWVDEFRRHVGGHPLVIYTGRWYWRDTIGNPHGANLGPLWHSAYSRSPGVLYGGWSGFTFWQYTNSGAVPGVGDECDMNIFYGDRAGLATLAGSAKPEPTPIEEEDEDVKGYLVKAKGDDAYWIVTALGRRWIANPTEVSDLRYLGLVVTQSNGAPFEWSREQVAAHIVMPGYPTPAGW